MDIKIALYISFKIMYIKYYFKVGFCMGKNSELPKLPYGQGSFSYTSNKKIQYKKRIELPNGTKVQKSVVCDTAKECMKQMTTIEKTLIRDNKLGKCWLIQAFSRDFYYNIGISMKGCDTYE